MRASLLLVSVLTASAALLAESAAGIRWTAPAAWKAEAPRPMRAATYSIPTAPGDQGVAECVVNFFGPGQGGGIEANVERWKGQVLGADGKPAVAKIDKRAGKGVTDHARGRIRHLHRYGRPDESRSTARTRVPVDRRHRRGPGRQRVLQAHRSGEVHRRAGKELRAAAVVDTA